MKKTSRKLVSVVIVTRDRREDLTECVESYLKSSYQPLEIIVVDNASKIPVKEWLSKKYPKVKIVTSNINLGAAEGRNRGIDKAKGEYILFTDDDAYAEADMVKYLLEVFQENRQAGIVQPLIFDKLQENILQGAGHDIDLTTGRIKAWGVKEKDNGQYEGLRQVPMCGCVWMVRRAVFEKIGNFDKEYLIPYEDCDFCLRARKAGFKFYCYSKAKTWHRGIKATYIHPWVEWLGITSKERAYRVARNKIIFMVKHSPFPSNLLFFTVILPTYLILHSLIIMASRRFDLLSRYWSGAFSGISYGLRKVFNNLTILILSWTDPLPYVLDKKTNSILDIGCGEGLPMRLIKTRMKINKSVGLDLFEPYIERAKHLNVHDEYKIQDIRKLNFKKKSFDIVIASHILEYLEKREAWKVLNKIEKIASRQVIVAAPIGKMHHPEVDGNKWQLHLSSFQPEEFERRGYKIQRYGFRWLLGEHGLINKSPNIFLREFCFIIHLLSTPLFYIFPNMGSYTFVAWKNLSFNNDSMDKFKIFLMSLSDPLPWVVDKSATSILDIGCGQGKPMAMIKLWMKVDRSLGVDLYKPYIKQARSQGIHDEYIISDVRKIHFKPRSFDIVLASHVLEHLPEKDAWKLLKKMESIAAKQVVVATPIGEIYQPTFDENILQEHKSSFVPEQFSSRGYKIVKYGMRWLLDEHSEGLVYKVKNPQLKKLIYLFNFILTPVYYLFPQICDYSFVAYKDMHDES